MKSDRILGAVLALAVSAAAQAASSGEVLERSKPGDWRRPAPENTLYLELDSGRVIIELAPQFAPETVANIRKLARSGYFDGLAIIRVQDNYVVQWGDPQADGGEARPEPEPEQAIPAEFTREWEAGLPFTPLPDADTYAPQTGYIDGFPAARNDRRIWLSHCYGMLGVARGQAPDSGTGSQLYVIIGHAPRHLDRNITLAGRVLQGMEQLSSLPRGHGPLGFYEADQTMPPIRSIRLAADLPEDQRTPLEVLRTDGARFKAYIESRRSREEDWFLEPTGRIELCNVGVPVRTP